MNLKRNPEAFLLIQAMRRPPPPPANFNLYRILIKRMFDLGFAIALLPFLVPLIFGLWLIARRDGAAGFYAQERVGLNGCVFKCYKIRTMVPNAETILKDLCKSNPELAHEWHTNQKLANDPRITRIGRFLRATSLDELPQIWNVFRGDMSFVGPRPFMVDQDTIYRAAGGEAYFRLRPGITGLWQIHGRGTTSFVCRVRFDNQYLKHMSWFGDLKLILKTVKVIFDRSGH